MKFTAQGNVVIGEKGKKAKPYTKGEPVEVSQEYLDANPHLKAMLTPDGHDGEARPEKKADAKADAKTDDKKFEKKKPTRATKKSPKVTTVPTKAKKASKKKG